MDQGQRLFSNTRKTVVAVFLACHKVHAYMDNCNLQVPPSMNFLDSSTLPESCSYNIMSMFIHA